MYINAKCKLFGTTITALENFAVYFNDNPELCTF